jgi:hypothetical protein
MLTEIAVFKPYVAVISPRAGDKAAFLFNVRRSSKSAILSNKSNLNVLGR